MGAVRIAELEPRVKIDLPSAYPYQKTLVAIARHIAAQGSCVDAPVGARLF
jgi:hypothetical protein